METANEIDAPFSRGVRWAPRPTGKAEFQGFSQTGTENPMTDSRLPLAELATTSGGNDFLRAITEKALHPMMKADVVISTRRRAA